MPDSPVGAGRADKATSSLSSDEESLLKKVVAIAENAVDDTEDLPPERELVEVKKKSNGYSRRHAVDGKLAKIRELVPFPFHPNVRPLTISDLESCVALEDAAFANPAHRCTREKFEYRLSACPELCLGLFCTMTPASAERFQINTFPPAHPVETGRSDGARSVLVAHIVSTKSHSDVVTDAAMDYPRDFRTNKHRKSELGHQDDGQTICIHSLAVHPKLQGYHLGMLIMKSYLQQLKNASLAQQCALICQDYLVDFYERFEFHHNGPSEAGFGGGGWHDMRLSIETVPPYVVKATKRK
ncbi:hypothetical protein M426DRAFT_324603 [Hypoxylon sp. CI-4A]|nr:hypothetical protein M426DRAFT_324603 [Hypoxylon sp. CI-4A]